MNGITTQEMLGHYSLKLQQLSEIEKNAYENIKKVKMLIESSTQSESANALLEKCFEIDAIYKKDNEILDRMQKDLRELINLY